MKYKNLAAFLLSAIVLSSCSYFKTHFEKLEPPSPDDGVISTTTLAAAATKHIPTPPKHDKNINHAEFVTRTNYLAGNELWQHLALSDPNLKAQKHLEIHTKSQRGQLIVDGKVAMDFPLSTGRLIASKRTPKGTFRITEKRKEKRSTLYGSFVNSKNHIVRGGVRVTDRRPKGTRFRGAELPYWMRFNGAIGLHEGSVYRTPASNGCVRVPPEIAPMLFERLPSGSKVIVR